MSRVGLAAHVASRTKVHGQSRGLRVQQTSPAACHADLAASTLQILRCRQKWFVQVQIKSPRALACGHERKEGFPFFVLSLFVQCGQCSLSRFGRSFRFSVHHFQFFRTSPIFLENANAIIGRDSAHCWSELSRSVSKGDLLLMYRLLKGRPIQLNWRPRRDRWIIACYHSKVIYLCCWGESNLSGTVVQNLGWRLTERIVFIKEIFVFEVFFSD